MYLSQYVLYILLFVVLTPGILLYLPSKGSKWTVAFVHAILFAVVLTSIQKYVYNTREEFSLSNPSQVYEIVIVIIIGILLALVLSTDSGRAAGLALLALR
jgi:hypothetical protein